MKYRDNREYAKLELKVFEMEKRKSENNKVLSIQELLTSRLLRWALILVVVLMAAQQVIIKVLVVFIRAF